MAEYNFDMKPGGKIEYRKYKSVARNIVLDRISYFNQYYHFSLHSIRIKNQTSRWGSCSKKGNLNFNYRIALIPQELSDYVIVHELCHLGQFNHSKKFWELVSRTIPNYKLIRNRFKKIRLR